jgi:hypothetical protein
VLLTFPLKAFIRPLNHLPVEQARIICARKFAVCIQEDSMAPMPNQSLQQTAAAMLVFRTSLSLNAAAVC